MSDDRNVLIHNSITNSGPPHSEAAENIDLDKGKFLEILGDHYAISILSLLSIKESSAEQLIEELDIPSATIYRKIHLLENEGFIYCAKIIINLSGNEEKYYRCVVSDATVNFHDGELSVNLKKMKHNERIERFWLRLAMPDR